METKAHGKWHSATLGTGTVSFLLMLVMTVTALPILRRINYNTFYYAHIMCSCLVFTSASIHANTNFSFLFPGLLLWVFDWAWRIFGGDTGLRKTVTGKLEDAGNGWYRISLPASVKMVQSNNLSDDDCAVEKQAPSHPLQTYYLNLPSVSKLQNHAFTAAKVGSDISGPVFLFQLAHIRAETEEMRSKKEWTWKTGAKAGAGNNTVAGAALETAQALETRVEGPYTPSEHGY